MKWIVGLVVGLVDLIAVVACVRLLLPEKHRVSESARVRASPERLGESIAGFKAYLNDLQNKVAGKTN